MPIDLIMGGPPREEVPQCPNAYVEWVREATTIAHEFARKHLGKAAERQKRNYDVQTEMRKFPVGTWSNVTEPFILVERHSRHNGAVQSLIWSKFIKI